jgi:hypothetical protein
MKKATYAMTLLGAILLCMACEADKSSTNDTSGKDTSGDTQGALLGLFFNGTGFAPHNGQTLHAAVVEEDSGNIVKTDSQVVTDGKFSFDWDVLEMGKTYRIDYYADLNGNGKCDAPPTDHVWRESIPAVTGDVTDDVTHSIDFTVAACDSFK